MQRFYVNFPLTIDMILTDVGIIHQLSRVMRSKEGDEIILFDGDGSENLYQITKIEKKSITLRGLGRTFPATEVKKNISLYQALPNKLEKIEFIIQKGVEVGIRRFVFFRSEYSQKLILSDVKKQRLHTIAQEALEQCGGLIFPIIEYMQEWPDSQETKNIALDTKLGDSHALRQEGFMDDIGLFVGPEGGWSEGERAYMQKSGFIFAQLGNRVMRTETAGVVVGFSLIHQ